MSGHGGGTNGPIEVEEEIGDDDIVMDEVDREGVEDPDEEDNSGGSDMDSVQDPNINMEQPVIGDQGQQAPEGEENEELVEQRPHAEVDLVSTVMEGPGNGSPETRTFSPNDDEDSASMPDLDPSEADMTC